MTFSGKTAKNPIFYHFYGTHNEQIQLLQKTTGTTLNASYLADFFSADFAGTAFSAAAALTGSALAGAAAAGSSATSVTSDLELRL